MHALRPWMSKRLFTVARESLILLLFCHSCRRTDADFIRLLRQMRYKMRYNMRSSRADVFHGRTDDALGLAVRLRILDTVLFRMLMSRDISV